MATSREKPPASTEEPRRKVPRSVREPQMLESAIKMFAKRGYQAASMDEIAEGAGISKPMVYAYFDSKEGLLAACIEQTAQPLVEGFKDAIDQSLPPDRQLWQGVKAFFTFVEENREWWSSVYTEAGSGTGPPAEAVERVRSAVAGVMAAMIAGHAQATMSGTANLLIGPHVEPMTRAFVGAAEALAAWWIEHPQEDKQTLCIRLMNFAWRGFEQLTAEKFWLPPDGGLGSLMGGPQA